MKQETLNAVSEHLDAQHPGKFIVLRNVALQSFISERASVPGNVLCPMLITTKDYIPLMYVDAVQSDQTLDALTDSLQSLKALLHKSGIDSFYFAYPSPNDLQTFDIRLSSAFDAYLDHQRSQENPSNPAEQNPISPEVNNLKAPTKKTRKPLFLLFVLVAILLVFLYLANLSQHNPIALAKMNLTQEIPQEATSSEPPSPALERSAENALLAAKQQLSKKCESVPPRNGSFKFYKTNIQSSGRAYWKILNNTALHVLVTIYARDDRAATFYVAPQNEISFATQPFNFRYVARASKTWCNTDSLENPKGYIGGLTSISNIGSNFLDNTSATTLITLESDLLMSGTTIEPLVID